MGKRRISVRRYPLYYSVHVFDVLMSNLMMLTVFRFLFSIKPLRLCGKRIGYFLGDIIQELSKTQTQL